MSIPISADDIFFTVHKDRIAHIRNAVGDEHDAEFKTLGPHDRDRRRILLLRVPRDARIAAGKVLKIPFLAFADESIADTDETLMPIIREIMENAAELYGIEPPKVGRA